MNALSPAILQRQSRMTKAVAARRIKRGHVADAVLSIKLCQQAFIEARQFVWGVRSYLDCLNNLTAQAKEICEKEGISADTAFIAETAFEDQLRSVRALHEDALMQLAGLVSALKAEGADVGKARRWIAAAAATSLPPGIHISGDELDRMVSSVFEEVPDDAVPAGDEMPSV